MLRGCGGVIDCWNNVPDDGDGGELIGRHTNWISEKLKNEAIWQLWEVLEQKWGYIEHILEQAQIIGGN